ncbi:hypothetical protein wTpre_448 [Wolbachia endosymbiont of Trichogramma pretiosum]|nr:hypothetical protein wTpre_448 [Wolbachia endosymbiont of Trichogramma pretiosum]
MSAIKMTYFGENYSYITTFVVMNLIIGSSLEKSRFQTGMTT